MIIADFLFPPLRPRLTSGLLWLALIVPLTLPAATARAQADAVTDTLLVLGDSISAAYNMSLEQGWVALMAGRLADSHPGLVVVNASISGETTSGALRRLPGLLQQHRPRVVVIELGGNDGLRATSFKSVDAFRDNLTRLVQLSQEAGAKVLLLPMELPPNYGPLTVKFRETYPAVAEATGSALGGFMLEGVAAVDGMMQPDGIHPTVGAQPILMENVLPDLLRVLDES